MCLYDNTHPPTHTKYTKTMFILKQVSTVSKQQMAVSVLQQNWSAFRKMALHYDLLSIQSEKIKEVCINTPTPPTGMENETAKWTSKESCQGRSKWNWQKPH